MDMHSGTFNPQDFAWQGLTLTPAAAVHIRELVAKQPGMVGVRLGVKLMRRAINALYLVR